MNIIDFKKRKLTATEKKEKARAKKIYENFKKLKKGRGIDIDEYTREFLAKYGYEV